ncbi:MAG: hypothetical protein ACTHLL_02680 [Candidatus Nitrosocosmicus sp.]
MAKSTTTSTSSSQEEYIESLRQIKEVEDKVQVEIDSYRKQVDQELRNLNDDLKNSIDNAKQQGKQMVEKNIGDHRNKAHAESDRIIADAKNRSKSISFNLDKPMIKEIMDIIFSDL